MLGMGCGHLCQPVTFDFEAGWRYVGTPPAGAFSLYPLLALKSGGISPFDNLLFSCTREVDQSDQHRVIAAVLPMGAWDQFCSR